MWGVEGGPVKIIYGLMYSGGGTLPNGETYTRVYNSNGTWEAKLTHKEMKNVGEMKLDKLDA